MAYLSTAKLIREGIQAGKSVKMILSIVKRKKPDAEVTDANVRYYANQLKREGLLSEKDGEKYGCKGRGRPQKKDVGLKGSAAKKAVSKKASVKKPAAKKPRSKK